MRMRTPPYGYLFGPKSGPPKTAVSLRHLSVTRVLSGAPSGGSARRSSMPSQRARLLRHSAAMAPRPFRFVCANGTSPLHLHHPSVSAIFHSPLPSRIIGPSRPLTRSRARRSGPQRYLSRAQAWRGRYLGQLPGFNGSVYVALQPLKAASVGEAALLLPERARAQRRAHRTARARTAREETYAHAICARCELHARTHSGHRASDVSCCAR